MESPLASKFSKLIYNNLDYNKLCTEGVLETMSADSQKNKKAKYSHPNLKSEKVIGNLINESLKEYTSKTGIYSYSELLNLQIKDLTDVYKHSRSTLFNDKMLQVVSFVKIITSEESLSQQEIFAIVTARIIDLPFNFIWRLSKLQIFSFEQLLNRIKTNKDATDNILNNLNQLIFKDIEDSSASEIIKDTLLTLIRLSYELKTPNYQLIQNVSNKLLSDMLRQFLKRIGSEEDNHVQDFINIFDLISNDNSLHENTVKQYASNQLVSILTFEPEVRLTYAIHQQSKWRSTNFNKALSAIILSIIKMIGCESSFFTLDSVVSSLEVNWINILTFLGTLLLAYPDSASKLKEVIDIYIRKGSSTQETEFLILGFLYARHASMEGRHVFPAYPQWFASTFGSENTSPANNKQSFMFVMKFLTTLVPFESAHILKAHINQSIFVPKGCQSILRDYQRIAITRLQDLNEDSGVLSSRASGNVESKAMADVESAVSLYSQEGKIPSFVREASIFRRQFFLSSFLPLLLTPRQLPSVPDARMKLIEELKTSENIPEKMYKTYKEKCEAFKTKPSISTMEVDDKNKSDLPIVLTLKNYLNQYLEIAQSMNNDTENKCMQTLSTIAQCMEEATASADAMLTKDSTIIVNTQNFASDNISYQVVALVIEMAKTFLSLENCSLVHRRLSQLIVLLASTPSLQLALIVSIMKKFEKLEEQSHFSSKEVEILGVVLSEIIDHGGMFLPMKLATSVDDNSIIVKDLLLEILPLHDAKYYFYTGCLLQIVLKWNRPEEETENSEKPANFFRTYFLVASRLVVMDTAKMILPEDKEKMIRNDTDYLPLTVGRKIPWCCLFLVDNFFSLLDKITIDNWIKFELETSWGETALSIRVKHLQHWAQKFFNFFEDRNFSSLSSDKKKESGFLVLFWKLIDAGTCKRNAAELFILLQSLSITNFTSPPLLDEWKRWKKSLYSQTIPVEESPIGKNEYYSKLSIFMSFCHSLSPSVFCGKNAVTATLSTFSELIADLLEMEGNLFLSLKDSLLMLECLLEAVRKLGPPSGYLVQCFSLLKESVLFHLSDVVPLLNKSPDVVDKYSCFQCLLRINVDNPASYKSLPSKDAAILLSSSLCGKYHSDFIISSQYHVIVFPIAVALLGRHLVSKGHFLNDVDNLASDNTVLKGRMSGMNRTVRLVESVSSFLDTFDSSTDPTTLISSWKEACSSPQFGKLFFLGFSYLVLVRLDKKMERRTLWLYCFLLLCFKYLSSYFEETPDVDYPSLGYLSRLN